MAEIVDPQLFGQVAVIIQSIAPTDLGVVRTRSHRHGVKVWIGPEKPTRRHYEAQIVGRGKVDGVEGIALEIGFHAEDRNEDLNQACLEQLQRNETTWRAMLGDEATAGLFFGAAHWRRLSDVWIDPDLDDDDVPFEIAARLVDYLAAIEPLLSDR